jgi:hypothetical protein
MGMAFYQRKPGFRQRRGYPTIKLQSVSATHLDHDHCKRKNISLITRDLHQFQDFWCSPSVTVTVTLDKVFAIFGFLNQAGYPVVCYP